MDAELKAYLDDFKAKMAQHFEVLEVRLEERLGARIDAVRIELRNEMRDGFISVDERFRSMEARLDRLEVRIAQLETRMGSLETRMSQMDTRMSQLDTRMNQLEARHGDIEARLSAIERELTHINTRLDTLSDDMRQRFRVLTDRVAALAA